MTERLKFKGRLEEKKLERDNLRLKLEGLRHSIRDHLDPFDEIVDLKLDVVAAQAIEATQIQLQLKGILAEIEAIRKALGQ